MQRSEKKSYSVDPVVSPLRNLLAIVANASSSHTQATITDSDTRQQMLSGNMYNNYPQIPI